MKNPKIPFLLVKWGPCCPTLSKPLPFPTFSEDLLNSCRLTHFPQPRANVSWQGMRNRCFSQRFYMIHTTSGDDFFLSSWFFIDRCAKSLLFPTIFKVLLNSCHFRGWFLFCQAETHEFLLFCKVSGGGFFFDKYLYIAHISPAHGMLYAWKSSSSWKSEISRRGVLIKYSSRNFNRSGGAMCHPENRWGPEIQDMTEEQLSVMRGPDRDNRNGNVPRLDIVEGEVRVNYERAGGLYSAATPDDPTARK